MESKVPVYTRLTYTDRLMIEKLYNSGMSMREIARRMNRSVSAVSYEINRGLYDHLDGATWKTIPRYSATIAQQDADFQATAKCPVIKLGSHYDFAHEVASRILAGESPDAIIGDLKRNGKWTVSTSTLYRYIDKGFIPGITNQNLTDKPNRKKKSHKHVKKASRAPKGETIENRPEEINNRQTPGHWEMDTVIGKAKGNNEALLVLTERVTRYEIILKLKDKTMETVTNHLSKLIDAYPHGTFETLTVDNGSENMNYDGMKKLVTEIYYCHPYSSFERGSNENANGIIRRFFPKGQSMANRTQKDADAAARYMNNMHRRILDYQTPKELFDAWQATLPPRE